MEKKSAPSIDLMEFASSHAESVHVQITMIKLTTDNYLRWSTVIKVGIAGMAGFVAFCFHRYFIIDS